MFCVSCASSDNNSKTGTNTGTTTSTSTGGSGGTSGTTTDTSVCTISASDTTISDMEETNDTPGNSFFHSGSCMVGAWYATGDGSGTLSPAQGSAFSYDCTGDAHGGKCCAKVTATGFQANTSATSYTDWGWEEGLGLDSPSATEAHGTNASAKSGITFWAKGDSARSVVVELGTVCTIPATRPGGACVPTTAPAAQCDIGFAKTIQLTTSWQQFSIAWADFVQPSWAGYTKCSDMPSAILTINFKNDSSGSGTSGWAGQLNGSIYIDDLAFM